MTIDWYVHVGIEKKWKTISLAPLFKTWIIKPRVKLFQSRTHRRSYWLLAAKLMSRAPPLHPNFLPPIRNGKLSLTLPLIPFSQKGKVGFRCELTSYGNPQNRTVEFDSPTFPKPRPVLMASTAALTSSSGNAKNVCLFYSAETKALAERIAAESDSIELRSITWRSVLAAAQSLLPYSNFDLGFLFPFKLWLSE